MGFLLVRLQPIPLGGIPLPPCGSLASSPGSDNAFITNNSDSIDNNSYNNVSLLPPSVDHFRRSSDSAGIVKTHDITERINLAEEIRKLSDKLFQLSNINTNVLNNQCPFEESSPAEVCSPKAPESTSTILPSTPVEMTSIKHQENGLPQDHPDSPSCGIPWRRTKFKMNYMSRDVPLAMRHIHKQSDEQFTTKISNHNITSPNGTKDLLLQLLEHWDGPKGPIMQNNRHGSISSEWTENDSLGQRTISSLNTFFQSRATNKKITPFHFNKS
ncbi:hypothetical protein NQ314_015775 [Rhamnusium bicolor]|uniref:Uncharacterized protein n=1 Tax=Rhamnusium bicolor TaxID=1586634 RepID=A0AAV8WY19_9CUCU|nr:hypothetical protein NQ314_015775 [Rhamnusium bicolor]